jgi:hypothetical protein
MHKKIVKKCILCDKVAKAKGYCNSHYEQNRRKIAPKCSLDGCFNKSKRRQLCEKHYGEKYCKNKCTVFGCIIFEHCQGLCKKHYLRNRRHGNTDTVLIMEDGSGTINHYGYKVLYKPGHPTASKNGHVLEHRYIMSEILGRPLLKNENVHHKNGNRLDNNPENLELWVKTQPPGQRVSDLINWANQILKQYSEEYEKLKKA